MVAELCQEILGVLKVDSWFPGVILVGVALPFYEVSLTFLLQDPFDFELLFFLWLEVERRLQLDIWVRGFQERYVEYRVCHGVFG